MVVIRTGLAVLGVLALGVGPVEAGDVKIVVNDAAPFALQRATIAPGSQVVVSSPSRVTVGPSSQVVVNAPSRPPARPRKPGARRVGSSSLRRAGSSSTRRAGSSSQRRPSWCSRCTWPSRGAASSPDTGRTPGSPRATSTAPGLTASTRRRGSGSRGTGSHAPTLGALTSRTGFPRARPTARRARRSPSHRLAARGTRGPMIQL